MKKIESIKKAVFIYLERQYHLYDKWQQKHKLVELKIFQASLLSRIFCWIFSILQSVQGNRLSSQHEDLYFSELGFRLIAILIGWDHISRIHDRC